MQACQEAPATVTSNLKAQVDDVQGTLGVVLHANDGRRHQWSRRVVCAACNRSVHVENHPVREYVCGHADAHEDIGSAVPNVTMIATCDEGAEDAAELEAPTASSALLFLCMVHGHTRKDSCGSAADPAAS